MSSTINAKQFNQYFKKTGTAMCTNRSKSILGSEKKKSEMRKTIELEKSQNKYNLEYQAKKKEFIRTNLLRMRAQTIHTEATQKLNKVFDDG